MSKLILISILLSISFISHANVAWNNCVLSGLSTKYEGGKGLPIGSEQKNEIIGQIRLSFDWSCKPYQNKLMTITLRHTDLSHESNKTYTSNIEGIKLELVDGFTVSTINGFSNLISLETARTSPSNEPESGTFNRVIFNVRKTGDVSGLNNVSSTDIATKQGVILGYTNEPGTSLGSYLNDTHPDVIRTSIPVYNASCNITHPTNVEVPTLIPGVKDEVNSYFNIVLNCADKVSMQNNIQLTVNPVTTTGITLSGDKTSLLYNSGGLLILMNIFNSVNTETQMKFSTMYQFSNSSQANSFTIPMRAKFMLGSTGYGSFSFQTQLSVRYN